MRELLALLVEALARCASGVLDQLSPHDDLLDRPSKCVLSWLSVRQGLGDELGQRQWPTGTARGHRLIDREEDHDQEDPEGKGLEFKDEDRPLNDEEIDWLLSDCYQVGLISSKDLVAMGNSIKKSYEVLKKIGDLNKLILEESAWSFMAWIRPLDCWRIG